MVVDANGLDSSLQLLVFRRFLLLFSMVLLEYIIDIERKGRT